MEEEPPLDASQLASEIAAAEVALADLGDRYRRLWGRVHIAPQQWEQRQYPKGGPFWVIAVLGQHCLYFNPVEGGWGWGEFLTWGEISSFHWEQLQIDHVIAQTLRSIDGS